MNDDFWDRVRGLGSETRKRCEWMELLVFLARLRGTGICIIMTVMIMIIFKTVIVIVIGTLTEIQTCLH